MSKYREYEKPPMLWSAGGFSDYLLGVSPLLTLGYLYSTTLGLIPAT